MGVSVVSASALVLLCAVTGCSSSKKDEGDAGAPLASLDLATACAQRNAWTRPSASDCSSCVSRSQIACECVDESYVGKCSNQANARAAEADCTPTVDDCLSKCLDDCACKSTCLTGHDRCRGIVTDVESCVAQICEPSCR